MEIASVTQDLVNNNISKKRCIVIFAPMNKGFLLITLFVIGFTGLQAQDAVIRKLQSESLRTIKKDIPDTATRAIKQGGTYSLAIGQGTLSNWAAGGDEFSFTVNTSLRLFSYYKKQKNSWDNTLDIFFGYINTTSLGSRKNDDRFDLLSKYGYALNKKLNMASLANLRSQFINGYTYPSNVKTFASTFMSPGYIILSQGLDYKPTKNLSIFFSPVTARWVVVTNQVLSNRGEYGVIKGKHSSNQNGAFATISYAKTFNKTISYKGRMDLFSNYQKSPQNVDMFLTNVLATKISKIIAFSWTVDMIYDDDVKLFGKNNKSPGLQLKSIVGIGLQLKI